MSHAHNPYFEFFERIAASLGAEDPKLWGGVLAIVSAVGAYHLLKAALGGPAAKVEPIHQGPLDDEVAWAEEARAASAEREAAEQAYIEKWGRDEDATDEERWAASDWAVRRVAAARLGASEDDAIVDRFLAQKDRVVATFMKACRADRFLPYIRTTEDVVDCYEITARNSWLGESEPGKTVNFDFEGREHFVQFYFRHDLRPPLLPYSQLRRLPDHLRHEARALAVEKKIKTENGKTIHFDDLRKEAANG